MHVREARGGAQRPPSATFFARRGESTRATGCPSPGLLLHEQLGSNSRSGPFLRLVLVFGLLFCGESRALIDCLTRIGPGSIDQVRTPAGVGRVRRARTCCCREWSCRLPILDRHHTNTCEHRRLCFFLINILIVRHGNLHVYIPCTAHYRRVSWSNWYWYWS